jgi:hypothetical protein
MRRVMLRSLTLIFVAACATSSSDPSATPAFASVRDRLAHESTQLLIPGIGSTGSLVAKRYTATGWVEGTSQLTIANGELVAHLGASGELVAETFKLALEPIVLPDSVFNQPAELTDVQVTLASSSSGTPTWTTDDTATVDLALKLDIAWSIVISGHTTQLGAQHLPAIPLQLALDGRGDHVAATLGLHASGTLWSWADLIELSQLDLQLAAASVEE